VRATDKSVRLVERMYEHKDGIILRKVERYDLEDLQKLKRESWWGTSKTLFNNIEDQNKWYDSIPSDQLFLIGHWITYDGGGKPILRTADTDISKWLKTDCITQSVGIAVFTDIDYVSRTLKISGSVYKAHRKPEIVKPAFAAGLDFAFEMLNMHRVEGEVLDYHHAAQQLEIDYLGFKVEGRKRNAVYKCGRYYDALVIGMLREEWEQHPRVRAYGGSCNKQFKHEVAESMRRKDAYEEALT
jgi:RimJ/RimL family protein N-acetyltransferase